MVSPENRALQQARDEANNKLAEFSAVLHVMQQNGSDTSTYQQQLDADETALQTAASVDAVNEIAGRVDNQMSPDQLPMATALAQYLVSQFHQHATDWGNSHQYHDSYDGKNYAIDYEYQVVPNNYGAGSAIDNNLQVARTLADYQNVITEVKNDQAMLQAMENDYLDTTPWNMAHTADADLMHYYNATGLVIVVSFTEQALRLYQAGQLINAYQVATGQYLLPTPPGYWQINSHIAQSTFTSYYGPDSQFYFPPTLVHWAMGFNNPRLGYFIHASQWRTYYGADTNFPHDDPHNDNSESRNGSHGCVNLPLDEAQSLYQEVPNGTTLITY